MSTTEKVPLKTLALVFAKLGIMAFGGPAAHIAMLEQEVVEKRQWLTKAHFLDLMGATNLIPGPNSTEMTMHCGYEKGGWAGLFVAGACFIVPAVVLTGLLAWFYTSYGHLPALAPCMQGIKAAVLAIILGAIYRLGKKAVKNYTLAVFGLLALVSSWCGLNEVWALLITAVLGTLFFMAKAHRSNRLQVSAVPLLSFSMLGAGVVQVSNLKVFLVFLKVGAILYGSGYVLFAYLDAELVQTGWLSREELVTAIAIGQFTPGPVLSTATFVGYQLHGFGGAVAATVGIFLPSFLLVLLLNPLVAKMRQSRVLSYFLDVVNVAAVAIMLSVLVRMGQSVLVDIPSLLIAIASIGIHFVFPRISAVYIIVGGALVGFLVYY